MPAERLIHYEALVAPPEHLGVLIEPAAPHLHAALKTTADAEFEPTPWLDTTLGALRSRLRQRLELTQPVILTGHQPEFTHAGVFAKTIAAQVLAEQVGGHALSLTVDSDLPRTTQLIVPQKTPAGVQRATLPIPGCDPRLPYEAQPAAPRAQWHDFFAQLASSYEFHNRSLLPIFASAWLSAAESTPHYCDAMARAREAVEDALGIHGVRELRISHLCITPEFRVFVAATILAAECCATAYNAAQRAYRQRHRVRAAGRPVPPLSIHDARVELPLWIYRLGEPRRRLFAREQGGGVELLADDVPVGTVVRSELERNATHDQPWPLEHAGWVIRPRALALSAFARLFVADLFIHGIGGAKYDELMEDFVRGFVGVEPRPACCVTATVRLPLPHFDICPADLAAARHQRRDVRFNPQRHVPDVPSDLVRRRAELIRQSDELRTDSPRDHAARRRVFQEIRGLNEQILALAPTRPAEYDRQIEELQQQRELDGVALDREYFFALHPRTTLEELVANIRRVLSAS